jgi:putative flippase GtrA
MTGKRSAEERAGAAGRMFFPFDRRFIRFILVGVVNSLFSYGVYSLFLFLNVHYAGAATLASGIGALFNFKTIGRLVFKNSENRLLFRFLGVYILTWALTIGLLWFCAHYGINLYLAGFMLAFPMAALSFLLQDRFVFVKQGP